MTEKSAIQERITDILRAFDEIPAVAENDHWHNSLKAKIAARGTDNSFLRNLAVPVIALLLLANITLLAGYKRQYTVPESSAREASLKQISSELLVTEATSN